MIYHRLILRPTTEQKLVTQTAQLPQIPRGPEYQPQVSVEPKSQNAEPALTGVNFAKSNVAHQQSTEKTRGNQNPIAGNMKSENLTNMIKTCVPFCSFGKF